MSSVCFSTGGGDGHFLLSFTSVLCAYTKLARFWSAWGGRLPSSWASEDPGLSSSVSLVPHLPDWLRDARAAKYWPASSEPGLPRGLMGKEYLFSLQLGVPSTLEFLVGTF